MLFADCRNFTTLMHQRGPEAMRPVVDEFFRRCSEVVVGYDGIVDHFLGDAVLALFNVPIRHDDHLVRAVNAARDIQRIVPRVNAAVGEKDLLRVGIGVSSGVAYTGVVGSNNCTDYTALGEAVNIAARLQGEAAPGEVLVAATEHKDVPGLFPDATERVFTLKGIPEPVTAYRLMGAMATE